MLTSSRIAEFVSALQVWTRLTLGRARRAMKRLLRFLRGFGSANDPGCIQELDRVWCQKVGEPVHPHPESTIKERWDKYLHTESHRLTSPRSLVSDDAGVVHFWPEKKLHLLEECDIHMSSGLAFDGSVLLAQSVPIWCDPAKEAVRYGLIGGRGQDVASVRSAVPIMPVPRGTTYNYYHFVVEYLPRLARAKEIVPSLHASVASRDRHIVQLLSLLEVPVVEQCDWMVPDVLVLADHVDKNWIHPDDALLLKELSERLVAPVSGDPKRIFLSRLGSTREMRDEHVLAEYLVERGFTVVSDLHARSVREQMQLFSSATHVVAVHGAALANILWSRSPLEVIELRPRSYEFGEHTEMFRNICAARGDKYSLVRLSSAEDIYGSGPDAVIACRELFAGPM